MKKHRIGLLAGIFIGLCVNAQDVKPAADSSGYVFTDIISLPTTPVKDQHRSGTCWSSQGFRLSESEMIRKGLPEADLLNVCCLEQFIMQKPIDMFACTVTQIWAWRAFHDVTWALKNFGMVPESAFSGLAIGEKKPVHGEMDTALKAFLDGVIKNDNKKLTTVWRNAFKDLLNNYLGTVPEKFTYKGTTYTPKSFATDYMKINPDDYVEIGSFTHHPFYEKFIVEIPDNWLWDEIYNVQLNEMMEIIDYALDNGYTVAWGADVSDRGFASKNKGVAVIPEANLTEMSDSEISKWEKLDEQEKETELKLEKPGKEKNITQEMRQEDFDNYTTTDDHGMQIIGTAKDQNGTTYYKIKNSWGEYNNYGGYFYASKPYIQLRTIDFMIHKDAITKAIRTKLGIK